MWVVVCVCFSSANGPFPLYMRLPDAKKNGMCKSITCRMFRLLRLCLVLAEVSVWAYFPLAPSLHRRWNLSGHFPRLYPDGIKRPWQVEPIPTIWLSEAMRKREKERAKGGSHGSWEDRTGAPSSSTVFRELCSWLLGYPLHEPYEDC